MTIKTESKDKSVTPFKAWPTSLSFQEVKRHKHMIIKHCFSIGGERFRKDNLVQ